MPATRPSLSRVVDTLAQFYGEPDPPVVTDPFEMILWENIAYLASDVRRAEAFEELRKKVGLRPGDIRKASHKALLSVTSRGDRAGKQHRKIAECGGHREGALRR